MHDAVIAALPAAGDVTEAVLPNAELDIPATPTETGLLEFHTSGTPVSVCSALSVTTASSVIAVPLPIKKEVWFAGKFWAEIEMLWTAQVVTGRG